MKIADFKIYYIFLGFFCLLMACAGTRQYTSDQSEEVLKALTKAKAEVRENPEDFLAIRELGILYHKSRQFGKAVNVLEKAHRLELRDARTVCYLGLSYEYQNEFFLAQRVYNSFADDTSASPYVNWIKGRRTLLSRRQIRNDIVLLLKQDTGTAAQIDPELTRIVVLPINYHGNETRYSMLRRGLTEQLIIDLSRIQAASVVDRYEIVTLVNEIDRRESINKAQNTSSGIGKLLNADVVVRGDFNVVDNHLFVWEAAIWTPAENAFPETMTLADSIKNILNLQKQIVYNVANKHDLKIGTAARRLIEKMPTENPQAFLAYCAGLGKEDDEDYEEALVYYQKAIELDPDFNLCLEKIRNNTLLSLAVKDPDKIGSFDKIADQSL